MRALQRPGAGDHAAHRRGAAREVADGLRWDAANPRGPFRRSSAYRRRGRAHSARTPRSPCSSAPGIRDRGGRPRSACGPCRASSPCRYLAGSVSIAHRGSPACRRGSGVTMTNSTPASLARLSHISSTWTPAPPEVICAFFSARPPKAIISRVCLTTEFQSVMSPRHRLERADRHAAAKTAPRRSCNCRADRRSRRRGTGSAAAGCARDAPARPTTSRRSRRGSRRRRACRAHASISCATASSASSHDTSRKVSWPVRGRPSRQPSRIAGRAMRSGECTMPGIASSMCEGTGSRPNGSHATRRPSSTTALNAPQCASEGKRF